MARLGVTLDFGKVSGKRFLYIADCVQRDIKREEEERRKMEARMKAKARK